jgi:hypothetical protein
MGSSRTTGNSRGTSNKHRHHGMQNYRQPAHQNGKHPSFSALDTNHTGFLSRTEAQANPKVSSNFREIDRNGDGKISRKEYKKWASQQKRVAQNGGRHSNRAGSSHTMGGSSTMGQSGTMSGSSNMGGSRTMGGSHTMGNSGTMGSSSTMSGKSTMGGPRTMAHPGTVNNPSRTRL